MFLPTLSSEGMNQMSHIIEVVATQTDARENLGSNRIDVPASTTDAGRVKIGGSCIRFVNASASTKDAGRVKVGGSCIRF